MQLYRGTGEKLVVPVWQGLHANIPESMGISVQAYLSSVPKFLREKLRGFVDAAKGPLADWIPTIPPPSDCISMAKSLRTFSTLSLGFSKTNASENKSRTLEWHHHINDNYNNNNA